MKVTVIASIPSGRYSSTVGLNTKEKILNSAERIALRDGVAHLTIDAVAAEAGLSKGGVLYHFGTKEALVGGMVDRLIDDSEREMARLAENDPERHGRALRSYLGATFPEHGSPSAHINQVAAVLLTAILTNPELLDPLRSRARSMLDRLAGDGLAAPVVHLVRLAADGLWVTEMFGFPGPDQAAREAMIQQLYDMTRK